MQQIKLTVSSDNQYYCEPVISQQEWEEIIVAVEKEYKQQLDALLMFYRKPGHKGTCGEIGKEYSTSPNVVNSLIVHFNQFAKQYTGNRFQIIQAEDNKECFWPISMLGEKLNDYSFEWTIRPELCAALRKHLIQSMLQKYRTRILSEGLNNSETNERYKWEIIAKCQGKTTSEILEVLLSPSCNFIERRYSGATIYSLLKSERKEDLCKLFDILRQDKDLSTRILEFINAEKKIVTKKQTSFGDERTAAAFLFCIDPQIYTPYTSTIYREYCSYLGEETKTSTGEKYRHFLTLLEEIRAIEISDAELIDKLHEETEGLVWSDLLNAQDVLWQMQSQIVIKQYWLAGYSFGSGQNQLARFLKDGIWEGYNNNDLNNIREGDVLILKSCSTKGNRHKTPFIKIKAVGIVNSSKETLPDGVRFKVNYISTQEKEFEGTNYGKYRKTLHKCDDIAILDWVLVLLNDCSINNMKENKYKEYIDLLLTNKNLVLTGAPGTGKTYMAKKIAEEMGATEENGNVKMVQFHPSYDYTDFVEGLRPKMSDDGFERKDGVFKSFCAKAICNSQEKYVFIIDEINRGELSKIFGELFFSIDPGYRGTKGRVETQYQNLVEIGDPFENGFYVPENVYIIGTMNDIDRGVESMDFAIRRRFAWEEVTAESRVEMLEENVPELAEKAIKSMNALNASLEENANLSSAYHIGPAYYLKLENYEGNSDEKFECLWQYHIRGVLFEYLRGVHNAAEILKKLKGDFDKYKEE